MSELTVFELDTVCEALFQKRKELDDLKEKASKLQEEYDALQSQVIAHLQSFSKDRYSLPFGTITIVDKFSYKIPRTTEDRAKFFQYLKEKGEYDALISVNSQTLNKYCRDELEAAKERGDYNFAIPGISEPTLYHQIQIRRS